MRARVISALIFQLCLAAVPGLAISQERDYGPEFWRRAEEMIRRLAPSDFVEMPHEARATLTKLGCTIPQPWVAKKPENAVRGEFAKKGQNDWAVLCSDGTRSWIQVIWGGSAHCNSGFVPKEDSEFLQVVEPNHAGYSRAIMKLGPVYVRRHLDLPKLTAPTISHDAIADVFLGKVSETYYCHAGNWQIVGSSD